MTIMEYIEKNHLLFDGGMGTMLQNAGLSAGQLPELLNLSHPELITDIHRQYVEAGSQVVTTCTFGASALKLADSGQTPESVIRAAVENAKASGARWVALGLGPLGQLLEPVGTLSFEAAYELYVQQIKAGREAGADLVIIETLSDLYEAKAAVLAAKEQSDLPVFCSMTFEADGRTFLGSDAVTAVLTLQGLGVDALGVNCSLGPKDLAPVVETMLRYAKVPVILQANAGLPREENGAIVYDIPEDAYTEAVMKLVEQGVRIVGGCCGTTPAYIKRMAAALKNRAVFETRPEAVTAACSGTVTCFLDKRTTVIGERINPTGKKRMKEALREGEMAYLRGEAIDQTMAGANVLDVNVGLPEINEEAMIRRAVREIQGVTTLPLQIDSADPEAIEAGVRLCNGKPIVNSVNGKPESMKKIFPIVKKYGALIIGLTLDETGIPKTAEGRFRIAERIYHTALSYGIPKEDLLIDCLVLTASAQQAQVMEILKAIGLVKRRLGLKTVLGVSNVSFGLPGRPTLNSAFLGAALGAGLDAAILNPKSEEMMRVVDAFRVLNYEDIDAARFIEKYSGQDTASPVPATETHRTLFDCILQGRKEEAVFKVKELLRVCPPLQIIDDNFIPALNAVGARFEKGEIFLPQLMQSADVVKGAFETLKEAMAASGLQQEEKGRILLATVEGDVHDIGKNIVKMLLENYGYQVLDLGRDVPAAEVVEQAQNRKIRLVGLSALMTTTVRNMQKTIAALRESGLDCRVMVGGAVLNEEYAAMVGADYYAKDAQAAVRIANAYFDAHNQ